MDGEVKLAAVPEPKRCAGCLYYEGGEKQGVCRFNPPQAVGVLVKTTQGLNIGNMRAQTRQEVEQIFSFPQVRADAWCGRWAGCPAP